MRASRAVLLSCVLLACVFPAFAGRAAPAPVPGPSHLEAGILDRAGPTEILARFDRVIPPAVGAVDGLRVGYRFHAIPAFTAIATPAAIRALSSMPGLAYLERNKKLATDLDTATIASRARDVWGGADPIIDQHGNIVDGAGVGIAIVDAGLDGLHPDFQVPGKVFGNYIVTPAGLVPSPWSAVADAHGTHVAGIAAGNGAASAGKYRGVAPGAGLYAFDIFSYNGTNFASIAFDWILENGAHQSPPIRVVNNSWHCDDVACNPFNPYSSHIYLASRIAESGITITWSAGNEGGDGFASLVNPEASNPTPGIIGVANYRDLDRGVRNGCVSTGSSRGDAADPTTWPDLSAPGTDITSTWALRTEQTTRTPTGSNNYRTESGTSMASPHVAGIAALMLQANPDLGSRAIEYILKATATKLDYSGNPRCENFDTPGYVRADPAHTYDATNYIDGHGLVDARAAVEAARSFIGIPPAPPAEPLPASFLNVRRGIHVDRTLYFSGDAAFGAAYPAGPVPKVRPMLANTEITHTTDAFADPQEISGMTVDVWVGTFAECPCIRSTQPRVTSRVVKVGAGGARVDLGEAELDMWFVPEAAPTHRDMQIFVDPPVTVQPGDTLEVTIEVTSPLSDPTQEQATWLLYTESFATPSRLGLGEAVDLEKGSPEWCNARQDCADIGGERQIEGIFCDNGVAFTLDWYGPPGSVGGFRCNTIEATCRVPGVPGEPWASCHTRTTIPSKLGSKAAVCFYRTLDGAIVNGKGRCLSTAIVEDDA